MASSTPTPGIRLKDAFNYEPTSSTSLNCLLMIANAVPYGSYLEHVCCCIILIVPVLRARIGVPENAWINTSSIWLLRALTGDTTWITDLLSLLAVDLWAGNEEVLPLRPSAYWDGGGDAAYAMTIALLITTPLLIALYKVAKSIFVRGESEELSTEGAGECAEKGRKNEQQLLPPLLFPSRTTHTRLFPKKHSFSYSYFYVGIPVGWKGNIGSVLAADVHLLPSKRRSKAWFEVRAADHLERDGTELGLHGKLSKYLRKEGVMDQDWVFAYLVTAPRFLGYSFNPVSFWYIYNQQFQLFKMVLEVNNTFDERRMYLLDAQGQGPLSPPDNDLQEATRATDEPELSSKAVKFSNVWDKDFHVSPFNSRKGSYSLTATDPLAESHSKGKDKMIDNLIVLHSSKHHPKLLARVFSSGPPQNPATLSRLNLIPFLLRWCWVGFMTFPRILREAAKLYFKRGLHVWFRPEVLASSIGRRHSGEEERLERYFRRFLAYAVANCKTEIVVVYQPPGGMGTEARFATPNMASRQTDGRGEGTVQIRVLSPAFYTRLAHYPHMREAFDREGLATDIKNRTVSISSPILLHNLLEAVKPSLLHPHSSAEQKPGVVERWRWRLLQRLRCPPPAVAYPEAVADGRSVVQDIRAFPLGDLDRYVLGNRERGERDRYRRTVVKVLLANRLAGGFGGLLRLGDLLIRAGLLLLVYRIAAVERDKWTGGAGYMGVSFVIRDLVLWTPHVWSWIKR
ncbi:hypothetical protein M8818_004190 [Zalaria obscura]|uniref:Uncharacterized protein n=1 Tax=Zalaria obscura TaxID=2024903 RepID=A0ACC3SCJ3_9PEZI